MLCIFALASNAISALILFVSSDDKPGRQDLEAAQAPSTGYHKAWRFFDLNITTYH